MWLSRFLVVLIVFALCFPAEAQQPNKIPRIGVLLGRDVPRLKSFRQGMRDLGYIEDKIFSLSTDSQKETPTGFRLSLLN
jgi:hypothetical protein